MADASVRLVGPQQTSGQQPASGTAPNPLARLAHRSPVRSAVAVLVPLAGFSAWAIVDRGLELYIQRVINGLTDGVLYGAVALALVVVFKATKIINFAQGAMATIGTFVALTFVDAWALPVGLAIVLAMVVSAAGAAVVERTIVRPFDPKNHLAITIVTLALFLVLDAVVALIWGFTPRAFPSVFPNGVADFVGIDGARLYFTAIGTLATAMAAIGAIELVLARTKLGLAFRCVANDIDAARFLGVGIGRTVQASWAIAAAAGTLAGCLVATTAPITPNFMTSVLVYAFAGATLGGLDSTIGSLVGGVLVGLTISLVTGYITVIGGGLSVAVAFVVIIAVLQFKPTGLLGRRILERV